MLQRHSGNGWLASGFIIYLIIYLILIRKQKNKLTFTLLFCYLALVIDLTLFPIPYNQSAFEHIREFHSFSISLDLFEGTSKTQNILNFLMFVPLGILLPLRYKEIKATRAISLILGATLFIELTQLITSYLKLNVRIFDVDDLLFNFLGGFVAYLGYRLFFIIKDRN